VNLVPPLISPDSIHCLELGEATSQAVAAPQQTPEPPSRARRAVPNSSLSAAICYLAPKVRTQLILLQGPAPRHPFSRLMGNCGDPIEVLVVVPHNGIARLGGGSNDQVGELDAAMMKRSPKCEPLLDIESAVELSASAGELVQGHEFSRQPLVVLSGTGAVKNLKANLCACRQRIFSKARLPKPSDLWML